MKRIFFYLLLFSACTVAAYDLLSTWRGVSLLTAPYSSEAIFRKAIRWTPSNPDPYHGLSLFYQWDLQSMDLERSLSYVQQAIERNPLQQAYWIHLAKIYKLLQEKEGFEGALSRAVLVNPTSYQGRWTVGTLFLQAEEMSRALPHFSYLLRHYPEQSNQVYEVWSKIVADPDVLLEKLVSDDPSSLRAYLAHLYERQDSELAKKVWQRRVSLGQKVDRDETLRHVDFLMRCKEFDEAMRVWKDWTIGQGWSDPMDGNLMTNGSFEREETLGEGFDWRIAHTKGARAEIDRSVASEGQKSLRITFDGTENVDFHHVQQIVLLKPDTEYWLRTYVKAKAVTTKSGLKIEVFGIGSSFYGSSEPVVGDSPWQEVGLRFRTAPDSRAGVGRVRRERTNRFDRLISGTVWLDHIRLTEVKRQKM